MSSTKTLIYVPPIRSDFVLSSVVLVELWLTVAIELVVIVTTSVFAVCPFRAAIVVTTNYLRWFCLGLGRDLVGLGPGVVHLGRGVGSITWDLGIGHRFVVAGWVSGLGLASNWTGSIKRSVAHSQVSVDVVMSLSLGGSLVSLAAARFELGCGSSFVVF